MMLIENVYDLEEVVYLQVDEDQMPFMITQILVTPLGCMYIISSGDISFTCYAEELSRERNMELVTR